jgi:hypothetical protein
MNWKLAFELAGMILLVLVFCWTPVLAAHRALFRNHGSRNSAVILPGGAVEFSVGPRSLLIATGLAVYALTNSGLRFARHHSTWQEFAFNGVCLAIAFVVIWDLPGTIVVDDFGIEQRFWVRPHKRIRWNEIEEINTGNKVRLITITSCDRSKIVFNGDLADRPRFLREIKQHCGDNLPTDFPAE